MRLSSSACTPTFISRKNVLNRKRAPASRNTRASVRSMGWHVFGFSLTVRKLKLLSGVLGQGDLLDWQKEAHALQQEDAEQMWGNRVLPGCGSVCQRNTWPPVSHHSPRAQTWTFERPGASNTKIQREDPQTTCLPTLGRTRSSSWQSAEGPG